MAFTRARGAGGSETNKTNGARKSRTACGGGIDLEYEARGCEELQNNSEGGGEGGGLQHKEINKSQKQGARADDC
jgi:hypothetical protein